MRVLVPEPPKNRIVYLNICTEFFANTKKSKKEKVFLGVKKVAKIIAQLVLQHIPFLLFKATTSLLFLFSFYQQCITVYLLLSLFCVFMFLFLKHNQQIVQERTQNIILPIMFLNKQQLLIPT